VELSLPITVKMAKKTKIWKPRSTPAMSKYLTELDEESSPLTLQEPAYQPYTEPLAPWQLFQITTGYLTTNKKEAVKNKALTAATFLETKSNEDQNHLDIYTDGSTCETTKKTTCAVYIPATQTKETWLLSNFTNSFNAELAAIKQALTLTYNQDWNEITIYTDSKSAIHAISNFKWKSSNYIPEIIQQINNYKSAGTKINLFWIPSHAGITGNKIADQLANNRRTEDDGETMCHTPNMAELMKS
jgi:ribonuclease HI